MKKRLRFTLFIPVLLLLAACTNTNTSKTPEKKEALNVITTFYPMYDFTKEIVGDAGKVSLLIPSGVEPHDYEPSAKNIASIQEANVFVYNSEHFETWVPSALKTIDTKNVTVVEASKGIALIEGVEDEHEHEGEGEKEEHEEEHLDPHVWLSPNLAKKEVETIRDSLIKAYPKEKETFEKNATAYLEKLTALDEEYKKAFAGAKERNFVTQHAAFGYIAKEYDLNQVPISGLSPEEEPSAARLAELKTYVTKNKIQRIYFEETASDKVAKTLADETGVKLAVLNPLEGLSKEDLDEGKNYLSVMQENLKQLQLTIK